MEVLCFVAGMVFYYQKSLHALLWLAACYFLSFRMSCVYFFCAAVVIGFFHQFNLKDKGMPLRDSIEKAYYVGQIISLPIVKRDKTQFELSLIQLNGKIVKTRALISCYRQCPALKPGEMWAFKGKLKKPTNFANQGGFDYEAFLRSKHLNWIGYIQGISAKKIGVGGGQILRLRAYLASRFNQSIRSPQTLGIVEALTLGMTGGIEKKQWDLFRSTGTTHLMVISGGHIGLVIGIGYFLITSLWRQFPSLCLLRPASEVGSFGGVIMGFIYALLAGLNPPTQRAIATAFCMALSFFFSKKITSWQAWRYSLLAVLLIDPHSILLPGFYLSFGAVLTLLLARQRYAQKGIFQFLTIQMACLLGLLPLTLYWFSYGSLVGFFANCLAIPWVGFVMLPLALFNLILLPWFNHTFLLTPLIYSVDLLISFLQWLDKISIVNLTFSIQQGVFAFGLWIALFIIFFIPLRHFFLPVLLISLGSLFPGFPKIKPNEAVVSLLDVGQGLSVVVRTLHHTLIFDTGMKFYRGSDMGKLVIIPYLKSLGIKKIDTLVISHPDLDHRGGSPSIRKTFQIGEFMVNDPSFYHEGSNCHFKKSWIWDGIHFEFLPILKKFKDKNNLSCVLKIKSRNASLLLTGDIERQAEAYLIKNYSNKLQADMLVVPHHGSKTSSSRDFVSKISPEIAFLSFATANRYHFPHQATLDTLKNQGSAIVSTAHCGEIDITLKANTSFMINSFKKCKL